MTEGGGGRFIMLIKSGTGGGAGVVEFINMLEAAWAEGVDLLC